MSCNRHRKKQIPALGYCSMQSIMHLTTNTSLSWLYLRTVMCMYFALHWQRTSCVPFYQRRGNKTRTRYLGQKLVHWRLTGCCSGCSVRTSFMAMQKRMLTRTVSTFGQWPQMHLHVQATDVRKSKRGWILRCTRVRFRMLWFIWSRILKISRMSFLASTSYYKTA